MGKRSFWTVEAGWVLGWTAWTALVAFLLFPLRGQAGAVRIAAWAELGGLAVFLPVFLSGGGGAVRAFARALARMLCAQAAFLAVLAWLQVGRPAAADREIAFSACALTQGFILSFGTFLAGIALFLRSIGLRRETAALAVLALAAMAAGSIYFGEAFLDLCADRAEKTRLLGWCMRVNPLAHLALILGADLLRGEYLYHAEGWHDHVAGFTPPSALRAALAQGAGALSLAALAEVVDRLRRRGGGEPDYSRTP